MLLGHGNPEPNGVFVTSPRYGKTWPPMPKPGDLITAFSVRPGRCFRMTDLRPQAPGDPLPPATRHGKGRGRTPLAGTGTSRRAGSTRRSGGAERGLAFGHTFALAGGHAPRTGGPPGAHPASAGQFTNDAAVGLFVRSRGRLAKRSRGSLGRGSKPCSLYWATLASRRREWRAGSASAKRPHTRRQGVAREGHAAGLVGAARRRPVLNQVVTSDFLISMAKGIRLVNRRKVAERRWTRVAMTRGAARFLGSVAWSEIRSRATLGGLCADFGHQVGH